MGHKFVFFFFISISALCENGTIYVWDFVAEIIKDIVKISEKSCKSHETPIFVTNYLPGRTAINSKKLQVYHFCFPL